MSEREIFEAAFELASDEARAAYLGTACSGRPELRRRVEALLQANRDAGSFLNRPVAMAPEQIDEAVEGVPPSADSSAAPVVESARSSDRLQRDDTAEYRSVPGEGPGAAPPTPALALPETFGRYRILKLLGRGGMGAVYLARDTVIDRDVALKVPRLEGNEAGRELIERFYQEARSAGNLHHPNICEVFDVGEIDGRHYISMRYVEGRPLAKFVNPDRPQEPRIAAAVVRKLALALAEAHRQGIVHRDLKPANVMIDGRGEPIVMDFGLARPLDANKDKQLTREGMMVGTPAYMSPEQIAGDSRKIGPPSDVWSLGVILFELLAGRCPYEGPIHSIIASILYADLPSLAAFRDDVPPNLDAVCRKMLSRDAASRYASMQEVADDLLAYLKESSVPAAAADATASPGTNASHVPTAPSVAATPDTNAAPGPENAPDFPVESRLLPPRSHGGKSGKRTSRARPAGGATTKAGGRRGSKPPLPTIAAAGAVLGVILLAGILIKITWKDGTSAEIKVPDGTRIELRTDDDTETGKAASSVVAPKADGERKADAVSEEWMRHVATLSAEAQVKAVVAKLKELNPGYDGAETHGVNGDVVTSFYVPTDHVSDITPIKALKDLTALTLTSSQFGAGKLKDLSALEGLRLTYLRVEGSTRVSDLSPLKGMKLTYLDCRQTQIRDLSPLSEMKLTELVIPGCKVSDLTPLKGMRLKVLNCGGTQVSDLSPLTGMSLENLEVGGTQISSLEPLKGMPLKRLTCGSTQVSDLTPLSGMRIEYLDVSITQVSSLEPLKGMPLKWLHCGATPVADLAPLKGMTFDFLAFPYSQVSDLSPLVDVKAKYIACHDLPVSDLTPIQDSGVEDLRIGNTKVTELAPLRRMKLKHLDCRGIASFHPSILEGMPLKSLVFDFKAERDLKPLRAFKTLELINDRLAAIFLDEAESKLAN